MRAGVFFLPGVAEKSKKFWPSDRPKSCRSGSGFDLHLTCIICRFPRFFARFPLLRRAKREKEKAPQTAQLSGLWGFLFWPARRDPGPCFSRGRVLRSDRIRHREKLHFCLRQKWRAFCLPTDRTKQERHHESGVFLAWPARRDSNPRPLESESTAISSFATGGYGVSFEHESYYTPSFRNWQEENARSTKKSVVPGGVQFSCPRNENTALTF